MTFWVLILPGFLLGGDMEPRILYAQILEYINDKLRKREEIDWERLSAHLAKIGGYYYADGKDYGGSRANLEREGEQGTRLQVPGD